MPDPIRKRLLATLKVLEGERAVLAKITTDSLDRDGEVLLPQGCDASEFLQSPTVFFNHDYAQPVGRCVALQRHEDCIEAKTVFARRPENHEGQWLPDVVLSLFQQDVIHGFSVGFAPIESRQPSRKDRERFGARVQRVFSKWKLLEYSIAPLPANQDALALAVSKGLIAAADARSLFPNFEAPPPAPSRVALLVTSTARHDDLAEQVRRAVLRAQGKLYA